MLPALAVTSDRLALGTLPRVVDLAPTNTAPGTSRHEPLHHSPTCSLGPECVNDSLILGVVVKQIAQRKEGMFPQV